MQEEGANALPVEKFAKYSKPAGLLLCYMLSAGIGLLFATSGYMEPDSCWLIKLGILILKTHSIPHTDPFSFTVPPLVQAGTQQPFVAYQWLSEVIFASAFRLANLLGPLVVCAAIACLSSICLLVRNCQKTNANIATCYALAALAAGSIALRLMVRPEIFTLLLFAIWLGILHGMRLSAPLNSNALPQTTRNNQIDRLSITAMTLLMVLWCNLHSGFVIGIIVLALYAVSFVVQDAARASIDSTPIRFSSKSQTSSIALILCTLASLINPYGIGLWTYLPKLFFSPFNPLLDELLPVSTAQLAQPFYYPFFILVIVSLVAIYLTFARALRSVSGSTASTAQKSWSKLLASGQFGSAVIAATALIVSISCRRMVSPLALVIAFETCVMLGHLFPATPITNKLSDEDTIAAEENASSDATQDTNRTASTITKPRKLKLQPSLLALEAPVLTLAIASVYTFADHVVPLTMPQATESFQPPFAAVGYLLDHWQSGNIFNRLQVGSILDMYGPPGLKVFADTRIDVFGDKILNDYIEILSARSNYKSLLDSYQIQWVFVSASDPIATALVHDTGWRQEFAGENSVIFRRNAP